MREPKFRAWDKITSKYYVVSTLEYADNGELCEVWLADILVTEANDACRNPKDVILEQYTGLVDDNLKEICEGDNLEWYKVTGVKMTRAVEWNVAIQAFTAGDYMLNGLVSLGCRVVGNIHES